MFEPYKAVVVVLISGCISRELEGAVKIVGVEVVSKLMVAEVFVSHDPVGKKKIHILVKVFDV